MSSNIEKRGAKKAPQAKKKLDFKTKKDNTIQSLKEVEYFLTNFKKISKSMKLYRLLK